MSKVIPIYDYQTRKLIGYVPLDGLLAIPPRYKCSSFISFRLPVDSIKYRYVVSITKAGRPYKIVTTQLYADELMWKLPHPYNLERRSATVTYLRMARYCSPKPPDVSWMDEPNELLQGLPWREV